MKKNENDNSLTVELVTSESSDDDSCQPNCRPACCSPVMEN